MTLQSPNKPECAINRAEAVEPAINSIVTRNFNAAMDAAKNFDANPKLLQKSNLAGFPFLVKDLSTVKGFLPPLEVSYSKETLQIKLLKL
ncbi:MAG: hypothetical protein Ct9H300mP22_3740 [Gammaproteobacteria bacterium]|nr:MAG: hypothetical protein Ct9H300mP22_3740 [Gammaproteobacteria bacterium]